MITIIDNNLLRLKHLNQVNHILTCNQNFLHWTLTIHLVETRNGLRIYQISVYLKNINLASVLTKSLNGLLEWNM